jgi:CheY-like chemotaxis protein
MGRHVCIIDDDAEFADLLVEVLGDDAECTVQPYTRAPDLDTLATDRPDLVLLDLRLASRDGSDGWTLLQAMRERQELRDVPVILCSADVFALREHAEHLGHTDGVYVLEKPFGVDELLAALSGACGDRAAATERVPARQSNSLPARH